MPFYKELYDYLISLKRKNKTFYIDDLNKLVGEKLPESAKKHPQAFFANGQGNIYSASWMRAGFRAKLSSDKEYVTFIRDGSEILSAPNVTVRNGRKEEKATEHYKTMVVKNFSGGFNEKGIGHEVINSFDANNNKSDYYLIYIPPYGSIASETIDFINRQEYKEIEKILVFDSTAITNVLKLKTVIISPKPIETEAEMNKIANSFKYGPKNIPLSMIDFNDEEFQKGKIEKVTLFPFTYIVRKANYYNLEKENIFIWHLRTEATNNLQDKSLKQFKMAYGEKADITVLTKTSLGEKNYSYKTVRSDFEKFYEEKVKPLLKRRNVWKLEKVPTNMPIKYKYDSNNFLEYVKKTTDENLYTNFICSVLNSNDNLKNTFFSYLIEKYFGVKKYSPSNLIVEAQYQSLIEPKKVANSYLKASDAKKKEQRKKELIQAWGFNEKQISGLKPFIDGQMDLYLYDDKYRIAIENKILCGINGKHEEVDKDVNQLKTYKTFLNDLNVYNLEKAKKQNKVILLTPKSVANNYVNYDSDVPVMSYLDLAEFFTSNRALISDKYRNDFLNAIYKHSLTREEDVVIRFLETLNK